MLPINPFRWTSLLANGKKKSSGTPMDALLSRLADFGTFVVFAPYYDSSRTSTGTYDLNGSGVKMDLTGAVFDGTTKAMTFDGTNDYAKTDGTFSTATTAAYGMIALVQEAETRTQILAGINAGTSGAVRPLTIYRAGAGDGSLFLHHVDVLTANKTTGKAVPIGNHIVVGTWNGADIEVNVDGSASTPALTATLISDNYSLYLSRSDGTFFKGSIHFAAVCVTATPTQINALRAATAELNTLIRAAFPWAFWTPFWTISPASSLDLIITIQTSDTEPVIMDWGDGSATESVPHNTATTHTYAAGTHTLKIDGSDRVTQISTTNTAALGGSFNATVFPALMSLDCRAKSITALDVSTNALLTYLNYNGNPLGTVNVNSNTALLTLICYGASLTALDVSTNTLLTALLCYSNALLTALDISNNHALTNVACNHTSLTASEIDDILTDLDAAGLLNGNLNYKSTPFAADVNRSAGALTAKTNLGTKGWTVTIA